MACQPTSYEDPAGACEALPTNKVANGTQKVLRYFGTTSLLLRYYYQYYRKSRLALGHDVASVIVKRGIMATYEQSSRTVRRKSQTMRNHVAHKKEWFSFPKHTVKPIALTKLLNEVSTRTAIYLKMPPRMYRQNVLWGLFN